MEQMITETVVENRFMPLRIPSSECWYKFEGRLFYETSNSLQGVK